MLQVVCEIKFRDCTGLSGAVLARVRSAVRRHCQSSIEPALLQRGEGWAQVEITGDVQNPRRRDRSAGSVARKCGEHQRDHCRACSAADLCQGRLIYVRVGDRRRSLGSGHSAGLAEPEPLNLISIFFNFKNLDEFLTNFARIPAAVKQNGEILSVQFFPFPQFPPIYLKSLTTPTRNCRAVRLSLGAPVQQWSGVCLYGKER